MIFFWVGQLKNGLANECKWYLHKTLEQQRSHGNFCTFSILVAAITFFGCTTPTCQKARSWGFEFILWLNCIQSNHLAVKNFRDWLNITIHSPVPPFTLSYDLKNKKNKQFETIESQLLFGCLGMCFPQEILPNPSSQGLWYSASLWRALTYRNAIRKGVNSSWEHGWTAERFMAFSKWCLNRHEIEGKLGVAVSSNMFSCFPSSLQSTECASKASFQVRGWVILQIAAPKPFEVAHVSIV